MTTAAFHPNPFCYQGPVREVDSFFGRKAITKNVLNRLRKNSSVSVVGQAKSGRTSFLHYVLHPQIAAEHGLQRGTYHAFYVDCKELATLSETECLEKIRVTFKQELLRDPRCPVLTVENPIDGNAYDWLTATLDHLDKTSIQTFIQLDDFEFLAGNERLNSSFLGHLRSLADRYLKMAYLVTSQVPLYELEKDISRLAGSPFFNIFKQYELDLFSHEESLVFLKTRLDAAQVDFPESILRSVCVLSDGMPHHLQMIAACAYEVWCENGGTVRAEHWTTIRERFQERLGEPDR